MSQILQRYFPREEQIEQCSNLYNGNIVSPARLMRIIFGEHLRREAVIQKIQTELDNSIRSVFVAAQPFAQAVRQEPANLPEILSRFNQPDWEEHLFARTTSFSDEVLTDMLARHLDPYNGRDLRNDPLYNIGRTFLYVDILSLRNTAAKARLLAESIVTELKAKLALDAEFYTSHDLAVRIHNGDLTIGLAPVLQ